MKIMAELFLLIYQIILFICYIKFDLDKEDKKQILLIIRLIPIALYVVMAMK